MRHEGLGSLELNVEFGGQNDVSDVHADRHSLPAGLLEGQADHADAVAVGHALALRSLQDVHADVQRGVEAEFLVDVREVPHLAVRDAYDFGFTRYVAADIA
eukprot:CAMPEP_0116985914 /NCGR_PEP_ID=MMETSP0467-20121206/62552_1 /TAXON_ID=283647 /ORGANISM="Mesodinium pulex, Strain SPMC105" /LENGTH=101 /DNA_ID=CAMNT_0004681349 /DNA_START=519 /DNA_END=824 /DNA_ORIENTATION=+